MFFPFIHLRPSASLITYGSWIMVLKYSILKKLFSLWNPVELNYSEAYLNRPEENFKIELDTLYNNAELTIPPRSLSQGKQVIAFLSLTCSHCRTAAKKIRIMHERNPEIPFYFVLDGKDEGLLNWITQSRLSAIVSDNLAIEASSTLGIRHGLGESGAVLPLHEHCLFKLGVHLGELWYLSELSSWLHQNQRHRFLLTAPPLRLPGAAGSPVTPVATV